MNKEKKYQTECLPDDEIWDILEALAEKFLSGGQVSVVAGESLWIPKRHKNFIFTAFTAMLMMSLLSACVGTARADSVDSGNTAIAKARSVGLVTPIPETTSPTLTPVPTMTVTPEPFPTITPLPTLIKPVETPFPSPTLSISEPEGISREEMAFLASHEIKKGRTDIPVVMMTYDDGGDEEDLRTIMEVYKKYNASATFFLPGEWMVKHPDLVREMISGGFEVGCHGWSHDVFVGLSTGEIRKQIKDFLLVMESIDPSYEVRYIRFPYGSRNDRVRQIAAEFGMQSVIWEGESGGVTERTSEYATRNLTPGEIILSHSTRRYDVLQAEEIVKFLVESGYTPVRISDGVAIDDQWSK